MSDETKHAPGPQGSVVTLGFAALGIVFGDIGTSPLYTFKTIIELAGGKPDAATLLGVLSLVVWTLVVVTTLKYVGAAMSADNDGEGGILALTSLVGFRGRVHPLLIACGLFGAALIYGDGTITPAISVLSALEGLEMLSPAVTPYIVPAAVVILVALFMLQPLGTAWIGKAFGPVMLVWFAAMAVTGAVGVLAHPAVLAALNPFIAARYLVTHGGTGFLVLGGVFLCVTGAEALYADMSHFGRTPIRLSWLAVVFPSLLLNYAGQTALVLGGAPPDGNIFYKLFPHALLVPAVILATAATIIASQAIITGAFTMTRQAMQLDHLPPVRVHQTSAEGYGQIYVGAVNWLLMIATVGLTIGFGKSANLASAYGIAVSSTMLLTTVLLYVAMREVWHWRPLAAGSLTAVFLVVDCTFCAANFVKIADGGYIPLAIGAVIWAAMAIWHRGAAAVSANLRAEVEPLDTFMAKMAAAGTARVPGTAVFLTKAKEDTPPILDWHVRHNRSLHAHVVILRVAVLPIPWLRESERLTINPVGAQLWRGEMRYGFMERFDIPKLLASAAEHNCSINLSDITYYVGHETIMHRQGGIPLWQERIFSLMGRNAAHAGDVLRLPNAQVVEVGRQVAI